MLLPSSKALPILFLKSLSKPLRKLIIAESKLSTHHVISTASCKTVGIIDLLVLSFFIVDSHTKLMLANNIHTNTSTAPSDHPHHSFPSSENGAPPPLAPTTHKRKRRPAGTPDPDAEVVSLSPKTLLESNRYVCEICNQGFQRDQNLQMHRRRHKVPWKLLKRKAHDQLKKRVYVCPERSCLHHDPSHALGDLIGIKKHFRRKHSIHKQWVCDKCSKGYAVQSDYKAHLKTCGTRGHSCDCGRVFSRVESFIEHQDTCSVRHVVRPELQQALQPAVASSSRTASNTASPSSDGHFSINNNNAPPALMPKLPFMPKPNEQQRHVVLMNTHEGHDGYNPSTSGHHKQEHFLELQLLPSSAAHENYATHLNLSIGGALRGGGGDRKMELVNTNIGIGGGSISSRSSEELKLAMLEKAYAEEARREVRRQVETAEADLARAKRMREEAQAQLRKAQLLKEQSGRTVSSAIMQITCPSCKQQFHLAAAVGPSSERTRTATSSSVVMSYMSSATAESKEKDAKQ